MRKIIINTLQISLFLIVSTIILSSCGKTIGTANDLFYLKQGMNYSKLDSMYKIQTNTNFEFEFDNKKYKAVIVNIRNFVEHSSSQSTSTGFAPSTSGSNFGQMVPTTTTTTKNTTSYSSDNFYLIFTKDDKLDTWGYMYEFKNSPSNRTNQFALAIRDGYKIYWKAKGEDVDETKE